MDMSSSSDTCQMNMLWNWQTINSCFLSSGWHVNTRGQFAGTCISIFVWTFLMVALTRLRRDFDNWLAQRHHREPAVAGGAAGAGKDSALSDVDSAGEKSCPNNCEEPVLQSSPRPALAFMLGGFSTTINGAVCYRPSVFEQIVRALMYGFEFSVTWLLALILMSYNGYVLLSAFLGAFFGFLFVFWEPVYYESRPARMTRHCC